MSLPSDPLALSFDIYQRYRQVADFVQAIAAPRSLRVLDVGGESPYLRLFLPHASLTVLDRAPPASPERAPGFVAGDGARLPFRPGAFDVAVSVDSLEHVPPADRPAYLAELRRVSSLGVVLAAPFDSEEVREAERVVGDLYQALYGSPHTWLEEHRRHGLPSLGGTLELFRSSGDHVTVAPNGYLPRWVVMLAAQVVSFMGERERTAYERLCRYYSEHVYPRDGTAPAYRHVILAARSAPSRGPVPGGEPGPGSFESVSADFAELLTPLLRALSREAGARQHLALEVEALRSRVAALEGPGRPRPAGLGWRLPDRVWRRVGKILGGMLGGAGRSPGRGA